MTISTRRKIAHILPSTSVIGGTEQATLRIVRAVEPSGFESVVFCPGSDTPVNRFFATQGLTVMEYDAVEPSLHRPLPYLRAARDLARTFRRQGVDLVHCADVLSAHYTALAGRFAGLPVVCHVRSRQDAIGRRDKLFLSPVDKWAFVSKETWRCFSYKVTPRDGVVVYDGIDMPAATADAAVTVRNDLGIGQSAPIIGMVARVSPQKDFETLIRAARQVIAGHPDARFLIVGDYEQHTSYRAYYEQLRRELGEQGLNDKFVFTGFQRDVPRFVAAMDVCVLCTHSEGMPLVLLEGMAQAKPTVATAVGGIPEIIQQEETGLLHGHRDDVQLANQISRLLDDRILAARIGERGRQAVEGFWTGERFARDIVGLYCGILGA